MFTIEEQSSTAASSTAASSSAATHAVLGAVAGTSIAFSMCNFSSPQTLWMSLNQFQLILLILLSGAFIPDLIVDYLTSMKATTCSFNFIPFKEIPGVEIAVGWFDYEQTDQGLKYFGIFSSSAFVNNFSLFCLILIIVVLDFSILWCYKDCQVSPERRKMCHKVYQKVYEIFTLTIYIRLLLESYQFLLLSSWSEIYAFEYSNSSKIISSVLAIIGLLIWIAFHAVAIKQWCREFGKYIHINLQFLSTNWFARYVFLSFRKANLLSSLL